MNTWGAGARGAWERDAGVGLKVVFLGTYRQVATVAGVVVRVVAVFSDAQLPSVVLVNVGDGR
jgi:hypothetical protein